jgi:hypothetical protein
MPAKRKTGAAKKRTVKKSSANTALKKEWTAWDAWRESLSAGDRDAAGNSIRVPPPPPRPSGPRP